MVDIEFVDLESLESQIGGDVNGWGQKEHIRDKASQDKTNELVQAVNTINGTVSGLGLKEDKSNKGVANGYASLDVSGKVPASQLPSYVDDVVEGYYNSTGDLLFYSDSGFITLITGETGKIYVDIPNGNTYRWSGSVYVYIAGSTLATETNDGLMSSDYVVKVEANIADIAELERKAKVYTFDTMADAQSADWLVVGDVVELLGYYAKGDGLGCLGSITSIYKNGFIILNNGLFFETNSDLINKKNKFGNFNKLKTEYQGSINTKTQQRLIAFFGDSHTWGQGAMNFDSSVYKGKHQAKIYARGYVKLLEEYIYNDIWNNKPYCYVPNIVNSELQNIKLDIDSSNIIVGRKLKEIKLKMSQIKDTTNFYSNIETNCTNVVGGPSPMSVGNNSHNSMLFDATAKGEAIENSSYGINAKKGLFSNNYIGFLPSINEYEYVKASSNYTFTLMDASATYVNPNKNFGIHSLGNYMIIDHSYATLPSWLKIKGYNNITTATSLDKTTVYIEGLGYASIVLIDDFPAGTPITVWFKKPNGTLFTSTELSTLAKNARMYYCELPKIMYSLNQPERIITVGFLKSDYQQCKVRISLMPYEKALNNNSIKNWDYSSWGDEELTGVISNNSINILKKNNTHTWTIDNSPISKPTDTSKKYIEVELSGSNIYDLPISIYFPTNVDGVLLIEMIHDGETRDFTISTSTPFIGMRGILGGSFNMVKNMALGCHSVGAWLGVDTDNCGNDDDPIDSITGVNHIEDLLNYCPQRMTMAIIQAPIVNEYLKQTPITTYKNNLTALKTLIDCSEIIIFSGMGQYTKDEDFGGVNDKTISYRMYRQATIEWAELQEYSCTYVDMVTPINDYLKLHNTNILDLVVDSNHPSNLQNQIWFEELRKIIKLKI